MGGEQDKVIALNSETIKDPTNVSMLMDFLSSKIDSYALLPNQAYYFPKDDTEYNINGKTFKFEETIAFVPKKHPDKHPNEINIISLAKGTKGKTNSSFAERTTKTVGNIQTNSKIERNSKLNKERKGYKTLFSSHSLEIEAFHTEAKINAHYLHGRENIIEAIPLLHPNGPKVYLQQQNLVAGIVLDEFLEKNQENLTIQQKITVAKNILLAIKTFHDGGYIHRDIKVENLMINEDTLEVELIDFEMAASYTGENKSFTDEGLLGTPNYIAPELYGTLLYNQWHRENNAPLQFNYNERTEIFTVAIIFYYLFSKKKDERFSVADHFFKLTDLHQAQENLSKEDCISYYNCQRFLANTTLNINELTINDENIPESLENEIKNFIRKISGVDERYNFENAIDHLEKIEKGLLIYPILDEIKKAKEYISGQSQNKSNRNRKINETFNNIFEKIIQTPAFDQKYLDAMNALFSQNDTVKGQFANWLKQKASIHNTDESSDHKAFMTSPLFHLFPIVSLRFISQITPKNNSHDYAKQYNTQLLAKKIVSRIDKFNLAIQQLQTQRSNIIARHSNKESNHLKIELLGKTIAELRDARNEFAATCLQQFTQPQPGQGEGLITRPLLTNNIENAVATCNQALKTCQKTMKNSIVNNILSNPETKKFNHAFVKYAKEVLNMILCIPGIMKAGFKTALRATRVMKPVLKYHDEKLEKYRGTIRQDFCMFATQNKTREKSYLAAGKIDRIDALEYKMRA